MLTALLGRASRGVPLLLAAATFAIVVFLVVSFVVPRDKSPTVAQPLATRDTVPAPASPVGPSLAAQQPKSSAPASTAQASGSPAGTPARSATSVDKRKSENASSPRRKFETARNYATLYAELSSRGDPDSLYFARRALNECLPFIAGGDNFKIDQSVALRPNDPSTAQRVAAFNEQKSRCDGFNLGSPSDVWATRRALRDQLMAAGDPRMQAEQMRWAIMRGTPVDSAMRSLGELAQSGDPYVLEQAGSALGAIKDKGEFLVGPEREPASAEVVGAAFRLAACDAGADCSASRLWQACAINAECGAQSRTEYAQRYRFTPAQFELVERVRGVIQQGIAAGDISARIVSSNPAA